MIKGNKIEKKPKYGMRKLSLGLCSGILAFGMFFSSVGASRVAFAESRIGTPGNSGLFNSSGAIILGKPEAKLAGKNIVVTNLKNGDKVGYLISFDGGINQGEIEIIQDGIKITSSTSSNYAVIKFNSEKNQIKLHYDKNTYKLTLSEFSGISVFENIQLTLPNVRTTLPGGKIKFDFNKSQFDEPKKEKPEVEKPK
ncbi:YSIRK-type signal peptide-containing protein, partial [Helcococcus ovis]|uniref:YSIRK-type signal peptide-containing protein n=1 Tax=Helcococcus ovis TaxID=72026 RepID=UPI0038BBACD8